MSYEGIYTCAVHWMNARGWREAYGKKGAFTQSLLQHTDIELNVLLSLLPIFARQEHYALTEAEQQALIVGQIAHDVGKETDKWQMYVCAPREEQRGNYVPHVIRPLTDETVADLVKVLGFPDSAISDATKFVNLHMAATRNPTNVLNAALFQKGASGRWNTLARIVDTIDNVCSIRALLPTLQAIENDQRGGVIGPHIRLAYHQISLRGVSSVMLHKAAELAYLAKGWQPILYFSDGTIYIADGLGKIDEPTSDEMLKLFVNQIEQALPNSGLAKMVVGNPTGNILPKPDLFDYQEMQEYLHAASKRVGRGSFRKKPSLARRKVITELWRLRGESTNIADQKVDVESDRVDSAQPEMLVFKFFKAAIDPRTVGKNGWFEANDTFRDLSENLNAPNLTEQEQKRIAKKIKALVSEESDKWTEIARVEYEGIFGAASFDALMSTSTLMPAKEMFAVIEPFWKLAGVTFDVIAEKIGDITDEKRMTVLIATLCKIAQKLYEQIGENNRPTRASAADIASTFVGDLIYPSAMNPEELAQVQLDSYSMSKPKTMKIGDAHRLCPICNQSFTSGTVASADFLDKPDSHTNRAVSHGPTGYIVICNACKYERFLQQLLLGEKVGRVLVVAPRNHIGRWTGEAFVNQVEAFREAATNLMSNSTSNPNERVTLSLTYVIAKKALVNSLSKDMADHIGREGLSGIELSEMLSYSLSDDKKKEYRKALQKAIQDEYELTDDADVEAANIVLDVSYPNWDALLDDIVGGEFSKQHPNEIIDDIRAQTHKLQPQLRVVCQTPNFALVPLRYGFGSDKDSDTNAALRELFALLLIGLALDCSVASISSGEAITFAGGEGVARVPSVPAIRDLVGSEWVGLDYAKKWLEKIGAASLLAGDTAYPERSNLYQVLRALTPGHILRRIEMNSDSGQARFSHIELIQKVTQPI